MASDHLQHDLSGFTGLVLLRDDPRRRQKLRVDIQAIGGDRVGQQYFIAQVFWLSEWLTRERVIFGHHKYLFVIEHRSKAQVALIKRIRRHQKVDFIVQQRANTAELKFLFYINIDIGPGIQKWRYDFQQPLVAGVAFHPDT